VVFEAIHQLMTTPSPENKRRIGFDSWENISE
jgi:hypothetical protein